MSEESRSAVSPQPSSRRANSDLPNHEDDSIATSDSHLIVGIGASAGGLDAFRTFLKAMPSDSGMGFVLVQHLDPDYESTLADILQNATTMPVATACEGCVVAPNTVWVIPQNTILKIERGTLRVAFPETATARRSSIDTFLISLAKDQGENAVAIILSGFGSDGTTGIGAIKEAGGFTLSQADFDHHAKLGMPQSAVYGGYVDMVTEVGKMPDALLEYDRSRSILTGADTDENAAPDLAQSLNTICAILHSRLNRDFGQYKTSTLLRRVRRRMQVLRITDPEHYVEQLRLLPDEAELLFREILISVTRFFRDAAMFESLAGSVLTDLAKQPDTGSPIRVWVAGCATGEEAYSLAILLREACQREESARRVTIFATDVDDRAINFARVGRYTDVIEADISSERLEKHFVKEGDRYRVVKQIRDMCVFSTHDVVKDPPFSKLDLVTCRNLLIYFEGPLQKRVISTFHYGINPGGALWLGPSETISTTAKLFETVHKRARIFRRINAPTLIPRVLPARRRTRGDLAPPASIDPLDAQSARILARYAPAYVIVDGAHDIQRFSGPVAKYLEPMSGSASFNLFRLLHAGLKSAARALLRDTEATGLRSQEHLTVRVQGASQSLNLIVEPLAADTQGQKAFLIAFQEVAVPADARIVQAAPANDDGSQDEINAARQRLQVVSEELETANEELQSSNEEFQSVNEELHSTVEELETSKEELQSINEELQTVNAELSDRAVSLVRSNSDLANLFDSTSIATLFLDGNLNIRRFTPSIADIFNVRPGDDGRPITDFSSRLSGAALVADSQLVLRDLSPVEREIISEDGQATYLLRIRPYRDLDNVIDGVAITLVDISERKRLDRDRAHLAAIVASSEDAIISHDLNGIIISWNTGAQKIYGYTAPEAIGQTMTMLLAEHQLNEWPSHLARLQRGDVIRNFDISRTAIHGRLIHVSLTISPIRDDQGAIVGASAVARDIAERKAAEERALLLMAELDHRVKNILAVVLSVVTQTLRYGGPPEAIAADIEGRILAIARTHNLLTDRGGVESSLHDLIATEIRPFERKGKITLEGPDVVLTPKSSLILALAVHELATNAAKYGSLSTGHGRLDVTWSVGREGRDSFLDLRWLEADGPAVATPERRGFGTKLIEVSLVRGLGARVERQFESTGLVCRVTIPLVSDVGAVASAGATANDRK